MQTRKCLIVLLIIISVSVSVSFSLSFAQTDPTGKSFLWQVKSDAGTSYLLGSVHMLKKEYYPLKPAIEDAFAKCDALAVEADVSPSKMQEMGMKMLQMGMYKGEETLKDNLSEKTYQLVEKKLTEMGMSIAGFQKFKPWMLALTITSAQLMKMGFNPNHGIDIYFLGKAADKKEILELEGLDYQVNMFNSFFKKDMESFLLSSILESERMTGQMDRMLDAWVKGDVDGMEKFLNEGTDKYPELENFYKKFLDERNEKMVEKMTTYFKAGKRCFVVVGAAHMVGEKGIVKLLEKKGYTLTQL